MNIAHSQVLICSTTKFINFLAYYGKGDIVSLSTVKLIYKLLDNPYMEIPFEQRRILEEMAVVIQTKKSNICTLSPYSLIESEKVEEPQANRAPVVSDNSADYDADDYSFTVADFTKDWYDADGDSWNQLTIINWPSNGDLYIGDYKIPPGGLTLPLNDSMSLRYVQIPGSTDDTFTFKVSDDNTNTLYSNMATFTLNINQVINQPPDAVGVNSFTLENGGTRVFTVADFTTETTPAYSDPEGDAASYIKITSLPTTGSILYNGSPVTGIISLGVDSIAAGFLSYLADDEASDAYTDSFFFSVADEGSQTYTAGGEMTANVDAYANQPPDVVGDGERTVDEGYVITFTRSDFTDNTTPPYHDPEGDVADKLKITVIPTTGDIKLDGVNVIDNDVINFTSIDSGLLTYVQDAGAGGTTPAFSFEIADAGSGIFVG